MGSQLYRLVVDTPRITQSGDSENVVQPGAIFAVDAAAQRRAMLSMLSAMPVMLIGLPLHAATLLGFPLHHLFGSVIGWVSAALATTALVVARLEFRAAWQSLRHRRINAPCVVVLTAGAAYVVSLPALIAPHDLAPTLYFDVAAMAIAWLLTGAAHETAIRRRYTTTIMQLAPLGFIPISPALNNRAFPERELRWFGGAALGFALLTIFVQLHQGSNPSSALFAAGATLAVVCPCAWGIARSSASNLGAQRAAGFGWFVPSGAVFWADEATMFRASMALDTCSRDQLQRLARNVRRAGRLNVCWSIAGNAVLPLASARPLDPLIPAALMVLAWTLIGVTNRVLIGSAAL